MEIYFYVLIAAVYLILGFVSADGGLPGIGKMASFIYEKTGGILRGRKAGRFLRENGLRRDLAILYPFGRTQQEARRLIGPHKAFPPGYFDAGVAHLPAWPCR